MNDETISLETLIMHLAGFKDLDPEGTFPVLDKSDHNLINSFARQVSKKVGFTDRQCELAKAKVEYYKDQLDYIPNLDEVVNVTAYPIREIDRSRWIKIINDDRSFKIAVRFTFQKKLISAIEEVRNKVADKGDYDKIEKIHYFEYSERSLYEIVKAFENKNFVLDDQVTAIYEKLCAFKDEDHLPGVYNFAIKNLPQAGVKLIEEELGSPSKDNILKYKDRSIKYGLNVVTDVPVENTLEYKIAHRSAPNVFNSNHSIEDILLSLENLNRFPILIFVPLQTCYDTIVELQQHIRNLIPNDQISVMFRLDNANEGIEFNDYIKREGINNKLDNDTKIVYSLDNKIPKPLLNSSWTPQTIITTGQTAGYMSVRKVLDCYADSDLVIHLNGSTGLPHYFRRTIDKI